MARMTREEKQRIADQREAERVSKQEAFKANLPTLIAEKLNSWIGFFGKATGCEISAHNGMLALTFEYSFMSYATGEIFEFNRSLDANSEEWDFTIFDEDFLKLKELFRLEKQNKEVAEAALKKIRDALSPEEIKLVSAYYGLRGVSF